MKITQTLKNFNKKRVRQLRLSEESETTQQEQSCCFVFCTNTQTNSDLKFYKFPDGKKDGDQATKWLMAIQTANGRWWRQRPQSAVCAEHFVSGAPSRAPADVDYAPSIFPKDSSALCKYAILFNSHTNNVYCAQTL
ncbi:uncharacterized protein LOC111362948 [Spodoptera litura]|uniref:Uncharacterized protein LOC111362948 n=1 Tax=Spodoptera litura TaxID=69820 RepID=A0A9J7EV57_SPOLT|nr:uncharacterized protein LOC111362948 [Spodoptera litura]